MFIKHIRKHRKGYISLYSCDICGDSYEKVTRPDSNPLRHLCGCSPHNKSHGKGDTKIYHIWFAMVDRCENPNNPAFHNYGGRGIKVDAGWQSFEYFFLDMGERPEGCSLDRIDNSRNYSKDNCRWASKKEQSSNKRTNVWVEVEGVRYIVTEAIRIYRLPTRSYYRYSANGLTPQEAINKLIKRSRAS